jgi:pimeloyl-ACP methyl ester carboxylesterase
MRRRFGFDAPHERSRLREWKVAGREALALARQATLLHRDLVSVAPKDARDGDDVVVLLHGLFATAGVLRPMRRAIELEAPALTASLSYAPNAGVASIAQRLARLVSRLPEGVRVHLVGHSMGGVVVRWYVQELGADPRVVQTVSLASPFNGTERARMWPTAAGRDITPESRVLQRLREQGMRELPHLSVVADSDTLITRDAALNRGERIVVRDCGHNALLYHPEVPKLIVDRVRASRPVVQAAE